MNKLSLLKASYEDNQFIECIKKSKSEIEADLLNFLTYLEEKFNDNKRFFSTIESRPKTLKSFLEKVNRKGYIEYWPISEDLKANQEVIMLNLHDLLGFRITCFFHIDEEAIYDELVDYSIKSGFSNKIQFNFIDKSELKQKNNHTLYKVSGIYDGYICFELQIKSLLHNLWGEVEHKTVYKGKEYDPNSLMKLSITEDVFSILKASDNQLTQLYNNVISKRMSVNNIFFQETIEDLKETMECTILSKHYKCFFDIFDTESCAIAISDYVGCALCQKEFTKKQFNINCQASNLSKMIKDEFLDFNLKILYHLFSKIFIVDDYSHFIDLLSCFLKAKYSIPEIDDITDDFIEPFDDDDNDEETLVNSDVAIITKLAEYIEKKEKKDEN